MNIASVLGGLKRRWYIVVPGLLLAIAAGVGVWSLVPPDYERTATQLLLPGGGTLPEGSTNPYLFLGGLTTAADVIVRAAGSEDAMREIVGDDDAEILIVRDPMSSGPAILTTVTAQTDAAAAELIEASTSHTVDVVASLQEEQGIPVKDRIAVTLVTSDEESTLQQRNRVTLTAAAAFGLGGFVLILAMLVDGISRKVARRGRRGHDVPKADAGGAPRGHLSQFDGFEGPPARLAADDESQESDRTGLATSRSRE